MDKFDILDGALQTLENRAETYGEDFDPLFRTVARYWSARVGVNIDAAAVLDMLELFKIARSQYAPDHADSYIDRAGYAALAGDLAGRR